MILRIPRMLRKGMFGKRARVSGAMRLAASPMISKRRRTASCFSVFKKKSSRLTPSRYLVMAVAESRISRSKPFSCHRAYTETGEASMDLRRYGFVLFSTALRETRSTAQPSNSSRSSFSAPISKRPNRAPGKKSTSKSTSLPGRLSPRASEPKTSTLRTGSPLHADVTALLISSKVGGVLSMCRS